jgi:hypothetical protein
MRSNCRREIIVKPSHVLGATDVFDTYWRFTARRQTLFMSRVAGMPPPWTDDRVLAAHRFTNVYRASDRVSQYLIRNVLYRGEQTAEEIFFRTLLFKFFNRIETWEELRSRLEVISWKTFNLEHYAQVLDSMLQRGEVIYSAAYIMPSPSFGHARKHRNHLLLLDHMMRDGLPLRVERARSLSEVFEMLHGYPSLGDFLAFQFAIDLNYSQMLDFSEMEFVVAGPGARSGIRKCFADTGGMSDADLIRAVADMAGREFERLGLSFITLWGRPLQLVDCQNLFCEVDKYARIVHPEFTGRSGRVRIKQRFVPKPGPLCQWYPPKWHLDVPLELRPSVGALVREYHKPSQKTFAFTDRAE